MVKILLVSDNHGYMSKELDHIIEGVDEIWHAGDIGDIDSLKPFQVPGKTLRCVFGNIDGPDIRHIYKENEIFEIGGLKVFMTHIGGFPGKYPGRIQKVIQEEKPNIFICGHSHILKVLPDHKNNLLHMNPGAYGQYGFHLVRTVLTFSIENQKVTQMNVIELGLRGREIIAK